MSLSVGTTIDILQFSNQELLDSANNVKTKLKSFDDKLQDVESTTKDSEVVTLIGGLLPGVGPAITRLQLNDLLSKIDDRADPIQSDIDSPSPRTSVSSTAWNRSRKRLNRSKSRPMRLSLPTGPSTWRWSSTTAPLQIFSRPRKHPPRRWARSAPMSALKMPLTR